MSVQTGRMVSADEARGDVSRQSWGPAWAEDLQHTVIVQAEQIAAARTICERVQGALSSASASNLGIRAVRADVAAEILKALGVVR